MVLEAALAIGLVSGAGFLLVLGWFTEDEHGVLRFFWILMGLLMITVSNMAMAWSAREAGLAIAELLDIVVYVLLVINGLYWLFGMWAFIRTAFLSSPTDPKGESKNSLEAAYGPR